MPNGPKSSATHSAVDPPVDLINRDRENITRDGQTRLWWADTPIDVFFNTTEFHADAANRAFDPTTAWIERRDGAGYTLAAGTPQAVGDKADDPTISVVTIRMMTQQVPEPSESSSVNSALIEAAADLLAELGPTRVSVRDIADRAGVNKGQIHHYFGGKQPLIEAAFRQLAIEHFENARKRSGDGLPAPLTLGLDQRYLQSLIRIVIDGDLETARIEFDEGISVPRSVMDRLTEEAGLGEPSSTLRASIAAVMALELGWAAFAPFIQMAVGTDDETEVELISEHLRQSVTHLLSTAIVPGGDDHQA